MPSLMQKAVTPQMSRAYLEGGFDRVAGFMVRADTVDWARTPAELVEAHGLGFEGSPFRADAEYVDVLRFMSLPTMQVVDAVGGVDQESRARTRGRFVDRPPFTGSGFVAVSGHVVPLWWVMHTRLSAGAELVRVARDGSQAVLARYVDAAQGWVSVTAPVQPPVSLQLSRLVGPVAVVAGTAFVADPLGAGLDESVVLTSDVRPTGDLPFEQVSTGRWRTVVPGTEIGEMFELLMTGRWNGLEMRLVDQWPTAPGGGGRRPFAKRQPPMTRLTYIGYNADLAEGLRLQKIDAAVYEVTAPATTLSGVETRQVIPQGWTRG